MSGSSATVNTSVPQPSFTDAGILLPDETDILTGVIADLNAAFGNTLRFYDSSGNFLLSRPQGQIATTQTAVISAINTMVAWFANSVDPNVASGRMQDAIGEIYFLTRNPATFTTVSCTITGAAGTIIPAGSKAKDTSGNVYATQVSATIGSAGTVTVAFVCTASGPVSCPAGTLTQIYQIISGWDSITNPADGVSGTAVEGRAAFESRRKNSVSINGYGSTGSVRAAVRSVSGVIDAYAIDNATDSAETVGGVSIPARGILVSVSGGSDSDVAYAIWSKLQSQTPMAGATTVTIEDTFNGYTAPLPTYAITFQRATATPIYLSVTIASSDDVPSTALAEVQAAALVAFTGTGLNETSMERINETIYASDFYPDIKAIGTWVEIVNIKVSLDNTTWSDTVTLNAAQIPTLVASGVALTLQ